MFPAALITVDYSAAQGPLLDCLSDLRDMGVTRVILIHVVQVGYALGASYGNKEALEDWLQGRAAPLHAAGMEVEIEIRAAGEVAKEILQAATDHRADLIVIGSRGQNMIRGLFLGSVAREVIRLSTLPVRLEWIESTGKDGDGACARTCHAGLRRVVLGTDFSQQSQASEKASMALARLGTHVDVMHVLAPDGGKIYARWPRMAQAALSYIVDDIIAAGGTAEAHILTGKPSEEIARLAADRDADLIVVGKHGQGWVASMAIGSTAANLCEIARRPVLMVPFIKTEE